jgi:hypothetical protein
MAANALLTGKKLLAKISDEGAKANCFLSLFNSLLAAFTPLFNRALNLLYIAKV